MLGASKIKLGLGCMSLSHAYGDPVEKPVGIDLIRTAYDLGVTHFDTAILYGFGKNESLVGEALKPFRKNIFLASKCGLTTPGPDIKRAIDGRPETIKAACDDSLRRLQTDVIDLYYLHRLDKSVPIEESVGALADLIAQGKIISIGLSEVSADTIHKAHKEHPLAAVQTEYSLWTRNAEINVLKTCQELNIAFVAFSPLARGFLTNTLKNPPQFSEGDLRRGMPRFQEPHFANNLALLEPLKALAKDCHSTPGQLSLAWLLHKESHVLPIPGTSNVDHLKNNIDAVNLTLTAEQIGLLNEIFLPEKISGPRYPAKTQLEIDTEQFPFEMPSD